MKLLHWLFDWMFRDWSWIEAEKKVRRENELYKQLCKPERPMQPKRLFYFIVGANCEDDGTIFGFYIKEELKLIDKVELINFDYDRRSTSS